MLDFSRGWTWFLAGLGTTLVVCAALALIVLYAERSNRRRAPARKHLA